MEDNMKTNWIRVEAQIEFLTPLFNRFTVVMLGAKLIDKLTATVFSQLESLNIL